MCGITGFLTSIPDTSLNMERIATRMTSTLQHRGPDNAGTWVDESTGIALAHRRLSILDLSEAGHQPMHSHCGRYAIVFNGEIYNHLELRKKLECFSIASSPAVHEWHGHSDTETLLAGITQWGVEKTLYSAIGMFAFALWDRRERLLTLARDRMGEKPIYYGWQDNTFLFGSELKALKAHPKFQARIDRGALALFLRYNYVPTPYSIYKGICKLPSGTFLEIKAGKQKDKPTPYWSLIEVAEKGIAEPFSGSDEDAIDVLERHLRTAVRRQILSDVPLGALLSGGFDSTAITALMQADHSNAVRTFTIGFNENEYSEVRYAQAVARHLGTDHTAVHLTAGDALALIPQLPAMYDEPFADSSQLPTHLVMSLARRHVTVALSGDGGDELFAGYNRYFLVPKTWSYLSRMPMILRFFLGKGLTALPIEGINFLIGPLAKQAGIAFPGDKVNKLGLRMQQVNSIDDLYVSLVSEWAHPSEMTGCKAMPSNLHDERNHWPRLDDPVARMMVLDGLTYLPDDILVKVDRAAMAVSLETRSPFLDPDLIEFAWSLPMNMKIRDGKGKWLLRQLVYKYVPPDLVERPKMGFGIPLDSWLRGPLREWADDLLAEERLQREGYLNPVDIRTAWQKHSTGQASYGYRLWSVLMFQAWLASES
ncbi:MAG: asparagine synthase (glutamine-hydrolyzing) [Candidatus Electrothrix aestuarii]|uniref:asparagine synthase (glutamine-hydrolyzing) n=1 Tax=Candidatus Electrothrix aestuarii TaxID=3062594 RepID=A0AAU8LSD7_9BACT|nr:asparagine synthase (glutamine-hydrolyzing) [Candidatus Electrothrix aestuarii]